MAARQPVLAALTNVVRRFLEVNRWLGCGLLASPARTALAYRSSTDSYVIETLTQRP
jgi:hypothetical protein